MTVELTSPALGKAVGEEYTGPEEGWLLANGYAKRDGYTGPGVANTGPADVDPEDELTDAANREPAPLRYDEDLGTQDPGRLDPAMTPGEDPAPITPAYDFDQGGVNDEAPGAFSLEPAEGVEGDAVVITGSQLEDVTSVTFGGVEATETVVDSDDQVSVVVPAGSAGAVDVVVTNATGSTTETGGFTYTA